jgi:hypothetical protein
MFTRLTSLLLNLIGIGSTIRPWTCAGPWSTSATALTDASDAARLHYESLPATDEATGFFVVQLNPEVRMALKFLGAHETDPTGALPTFRGWLADELHLPPAAGANVAELIGSHAFDVTCRVGAKPIPATSGAHVGTGVCNWVDAITVTADKTLTPGIQVLYDTTDGAAMMVLDKCSSRFLIIEGTRETLTHFRILTRPF